MVHELALEQLLKAVLDASDQSFELLIYVDV